MAAIAVGLYRQDYDSSRVDTAKREYHDDLTTGEDLVFVSSENASEVEVASFTLEDGSDLTDHAFIKPREISLTIFCSNRHSQALGKIYTTLINIQQDRALLTYISPEGIAYSDLLLASLTVPQEAPFARSSHISLKMKQIDFGGNHDPLKGVSQVLDRLDPLRDGKSYEYNYLRAGNVAEAEVLYFSLYGLRDSKNNSSARAVSEQNENLDAKTRTASSSQSRTVESGSQNTIAGSAKFLVDLGLPKTVAFSYRGGSYSLQMKYSAQLEAWYADLYQAGELQVSSFLVVPGLDLVSCYNLDNTFSSLFVSVPLWNTDSYEKGLESSLLAFEQDEQKKCCPCSLIFFDEESMGQKYLSAISSSYFRENLSQFFEFDYTEEVLSK